MGTFVRDRNINTGSIGSQGSSVQGGKVSSSNIDFSEIARGDSNISSGDGMSSTVDFGELFSNAPTKENAVSVRDLTANQTIVTDSSQAGTTASSSDLSNDRQHDEQVNVNSGTATKNSTTKSDSTNVSTGPSVSGTAAPASGNSGGGVSGGGGSSSSGSASGSSMSAGGNSATGTGETGAASGTGVSVQTSSMSNSSTTTVVNSGGNVSATGAEVSVQTSSMSSAVPASNINSAYSNTGAVSGSGLYFIAETMDFLRSLADTVAVIAASAVAAVANIGEGIKDGLGYLVAAVLDLFGQDDAANNLRIDIARDDVGEFEKWLFEKGPGKGINDRSWIKYDSALAKGITSFAEVAVVIAAAAAVEIITGGMASPVVIPLVFGALGLTKGLGEASERAYQNAIANGQYDLTLGVWDNLKIVFQGGMEAMAWAFNAKAGAGIGQMMIAAQADGWSAVANVLKNDFFSEKNIKAMFSKGNVVMNLFGSVMQSSPQLMKVIGEIKSGEVKAGDVALLVVEIAGYFGLNTLTDGLRNVTSGFISDKKAKFLADELLNGNKGANLGKYLSEYNDSSVQRILINMTGEDVYKNLNSVNADDIAKVVSMLDDTQKGDFAVVASMDLFKEGSIVSLDDLAKYGDEMQADIIDQLAYRVLNSDDPLSSDDLRKMCDDDLFEKVELRVNNSNVGNLYEGGTGTAQPQMPEFTSGSKGDGAELPPQKRIELEDQQFRDRIKNELDSLDKNDSDFEFKKKLILENAAAEDELMKVAHAEGMTLEEYIKSFKSSDVLTPEQQRQVSEATKEIYQRAVDSERGITETMHLLEDDHARLEGLDYVLKSESSISDKLARKMADGDSLDIAKASINDSVRYTLIIDEADYNEGVVSRLKTLSDNGYEIVDMNNAWGGKTYQGLNVTLKSPDGILTELQFHTPESFNVKQNQNHLFYELSRTEGVPDELKALADRIMANNQTLGVTDTQFRHGMFDIGDVLSKSDGLDSFYIKKFDSLKSSALDLSVMDSHPDTLTQLTQYFGDGGAAVSFRLKNGETIEDIRKSLSGQELADFEAFLGTRAGKYLEELTPDELKAITIYTGGSFQKINGILRAGQENITTEFVGGKPFLEYMKDLDSAMQKGAIDETIVLYRGVDADTFWFQDFKDLLSGVDQSDGKTIAQILNDSCIGKAVKDKGYISTSPGYDCSFGPHYPVVFEIVAPAGTKGGYINQVSQFYNQENELLLSRGTDLIISSASYERVNGVWKLLVRVIAQN